MQTANERLLAAWEARKGISEIAGAASNPRIVAMMRDAGKGSWVTSEATAWCGGAQADATVGAGLSEFLPDNPLGAREWLTVGTVITNANAEPGDVVVYPRAGDPTKGHVGTIKEVHDDYFIIWAGNQSPGRDKAGNALPDQVCPKRFPRRGKAGPVGIRRLEQTAAAAVQNAGRVPASIRNKNPGAQYPGPSSTKFGSVSYEVLNSRDGQHLIATFPTSEQGAAAMFDLLASSGYTGRSIRDAIKKWCGGFSAAAYAQAIQSRAGISPDTILTRELVVDPAFAIPLAKAMSFHEADAEYPLSDDRWRVAHAMAFPETVPKVTLLQNYQGSRSLKLKVNALLGGIVALVYSIGGAILHGLQWCLDNVEWLLGIAGSAADKAEQVNGIGGRIAETAGVPWLPIIGFGVMITCIILGLLETDNRQRKPEPEDVLDGPAPSPSHLVIPAADPPRDPSAIAGKQVEPERMAA